MECKYCGRPITLRQGRWTDDYWNEWDKWQRDKPNITEGKGFIEKMNYSAACPDRMVSNFQEMCENEGSKDHFPDDALIELVMGGNDEPARKDSGS